MEALVVDDGGRRFVEDGVCGVEDGLVVGMYVVERQWTDTARDSNRDLNDRIFTSLPGPPDLSPFRA